MSTRRRKPIRSVVTARTIDVVATYQLSQLRSRRAHAGSTLTDYSERARARVRKAQHCSYWMTVMMHRPGLTDFDVWRQRAEARVGGQPPAATYLTAGYPGWHG